MNESLTTVWISFLNIFLSKCAYVAEINILKKQWKKYHLCSNVQHVGFGEI